MRKQVSAIKAYSRYIELKNKPQPVIINSCPDCKGTGKQGKRTCSTCGGEKDEKR